MPESEHAVGAQSVDELPGYPDDGGGAAGVVFLVVCSDVTDHPVSRFATATPPKEGN